LGKLFDLGFASYFYTPIIVALVLMLGLALIFDALILLIQRGSLPWLRLRKRTA
jgi:osmoprotectant transport system permease protein